jgi:hypothetical protein
VVRDIPMANGGSGGDFISTLLLEEGNCITCSQPYADKIQIKLVTNFMLVGNTRLTRSVANCNPNNDIEKNGKRSEYDGSIREENSKK